MLCLLHQTNAKQFNKSYRRASNALQYADTCKPTQIIGLTFTTLRSLAVTTIGDGCRFLNLCWFKNTNQSWMQTSRRCLYAFLACNRASCFTRDVTRHHHCRVSSWVMWLRLLPITTSLPKQSSAFFIFFTALFSWMTNKNLQQDHCSSIAMHWWW